MKKIMNWVLCIAFAAALCLTPATALAAANTQTAANAGVFSKAVRVTGVTLNKTSLILTKGKTYKLTATVKPSNAKNKKVTWKSANKAIATVSSNGTIKGIKEGTVYIYVYTEDRKKSAKCKVTVEPVYGNTAGNIVNGGFAALYEGWIYYAKSDGLYKVRTNGTGTKKIYSGYPSDINVIGGWVYFGDGNPLYKMRTDGTGLKELSNAFPSEITVAGSWIYFADDTEHPSRIRTDGTGEKILNTNEICFDMSVACGWIYYSKFEDYGNNKLYKMRTDGTGRKKVTSDSVYDMNVVGDWIYYIKDFSREDERGGCIYKIRTDGTGRAKISSDFCHSLNVAGGWIYYIGNGYLSKMHMDGTGKKKLTADNSYDINIVGDWIYYKIYDYDALEVSLYKIKTDGTGRQLVK
jgi:predicted small secreted protein